MRILVVKLSSLGDVLHALPAVAELADQLDAEVDWAVQPAFAPLVRAFESVRRVFEVPRPSDLPGYLNAIGRIRRERYDLVVDFQGLMKSAVVARLAHAPRCIGPAFAREGSRWLYTDRAGVRGPRRHAVAECLDVIRFLGLSVPESPRFPINVPTIDLDARAPLATAGPRIGVAPLSRWKSKNWPAGHFSTLIKSLVEHHDARVYVLGGAGDRDIAAGILSEAGVEAANLCGSLSLIESMGVLTQCTALVSNDSGPMHMAAALGVRCVVPFGPTAPGRTGPHGNNHVVLQAAKTCGPCHKRTCPDGSLRCLRGITPGQVEQAVFDQAPR